MDSLANSRKEKIRAITRSIIKFHERDKEEMVSNWARERSKKTNRFEIIWHEEYNDDDDDDDDMRNDRCRIKSN